MSNGNFMHILKIIHGYPPEYNAGSEVYSQSICNELSKKHRVSVFTREENPYAADFEIRKQREPNNDNLCLYFVNHPMGKDGYRHAQMDAAFGQLIDKLQPDVAHIGHLNHLSTGLVTELKKRSIPILFTLHDFWLMCPRGQFLTRSIGKAENLQLCSGQENRKCATHCYEVYCSGDEAHREKELDYWTGWIADRMDVTRSIAQKVDRFIAPSRYLMNRFINDFAVPKEKISYLDYGFPTHYLSPQKKHKAHDVYTFGYIGTHIPAKGIDLLIRAFNEVKGPAKLMVFGREHGQSTAALKQLAAQSPHTIHFAGEYVNHNLADRVFSQVDCIVVPSIWTENSPLVIHEAQACQIPVITADAGGMAEYVAHQLNGLLFKHRDQNSLSKQLSYAVNHPGQMEQLGKKGYLHSEDGQVPSIEAHAQQLEKAYQDLIAPEHSFWRLTLDTNPEDCNLSCIMCEEHSPHSTFIAELRKKGIKPRRMDIDTVKRLFIEAAELGVKEIIPSTMGEPLLYKEFDQLFTLAEHYGIQINLTTNGTFPKKTVEEWAALIVPNTSDVKISWNGATAETAQKVMLKVDFEQTVENVKRFIQYRDAHYHSTGVFCRVTFQLTFMQNNMHELADIVKLAAELGVDRVKGHQLWAHFEEIKGLSMKENAESIAQWNRYVQEAEVARERYLKPNGEKVLLENIIPLSLEENEQVPDSYECPFLNKELWVSATGKISPCCAPDEQRQSLGDFGNITNTSLSEVLKSDSYQNLVTHYKRQPLCQTCTMRKPK